MANVMIETLQLQKSTTTCRGVAYEMPWCSFGFNVGRNDGKF